MLSNRRRPWTLEITEALESVAGYLKVRNLKVVGESGIGNIGKGCNWASGNLTHITQALFHIGFLNATTPLYPASVPIHHHNSISNPHNNLAIPTQILSQNNCSPGSDDTPLPFQITPVQYLEPPFRLPRKV
uniref:SFRICE_011786 n=1 Tax=Spodoptera frugiperda TaxID=7108 RepID=A0A2H1VUJ2_SPOFR